MESFGGNILIDAKLESLDANGILADLKEVETHEKTEYRPKDKHLL